MNTPSTTSTTPSTADRTLRVAHHHPGRLRVRAEEFVGNRRLLDETRSDLSQAKGVRSVSYNPRTGSLLVEYEPHDVDADAIIEQVVELNGFELSRSKKRPPLNLASLVLGAVRKLDATTVRASGGRMDLGSVISGGLAIVSIYSLWRGPHPRVPRWDSLLYWAYSVFNHSHSDHRAEGESHRSAS